MKPRRCRTVRGLYGSDPCTSTRFRKSDDPERPWECVVCGETYRDYEPTKTTRTLAECRRCKEPFLWNKHKHSLRSPVFCRACHYEISAINHETAAGRAHRRADETRAAQQRAVARFKPKEAS